MPRHAAAALGRRALSKLQLTFSVQGLIVREVSIASSVALVHGVEWRQAGDMGRPWRLGPEADRLLDTVGVGLLGTPLHLRSEGANVRGRAAAATKCIRGDRALTLRKPPVRVTRIRRSDSRLHPP